MTEYEYYVHEAIRENNGTEVYLALQAELDLKMFGCPFNQNLIDICNEWISTHTLNKIAPAVMA